MLPALEINLALWGMILCAAVQAVQQFGVYLVQKPSNDCEGGPAHRDQPSNCGDAGQS